MAVRMRPSLVIASALATAGVVAAALWLFPPRWLLNVMKPVDLSDPVATGEALVLKYNCRQCHYIGGEGMHKGPDLQGVSMRLDSVSLRLWLRDPSSIRWKTSMPNFRLSDGEIEAIVAYLSRLDGGPS